MCKLLYKRRRKEDFKAGFYTTLNNAARREPPEEAIALDDAHLHAWERHPCRHVIPNFPDFEAKMDCLIETMERVVSG